MTEAKRLFLAEVPSMSLQWLAGSENVLELAYGGRHLVFHVWPQPNSKRSLSPQLLSTP